MDKENFVLFAKFIMRDEKGSNKDSYVIKNGDIDCTKDTYEIFQQTLATQINNDLEYLMREDYSLYLKRKEDGKLIVSHKKR